jgi:hypothetical protein
MGYSLIYPYRLVTASNSGTGQSDRTVLASPTLSRKIAGILEITFYLADHYPSPIPKTHESIIGKSLRELHALDYFSLSFPDRPHVAQGFETAVESALQGISRKGIETL